MRLCSTHVMRLVSVSLFALLFPKFFSFEYVPRSLIMMSKYAVSFSDSFTVIIGVYLRINIHTRYTPIRMKSFQYYFLGSNCCRLFEMFGCHGPSFFFFAGKECATLGTNFSWVKSKFMTAHTQFVTRRWHAIQSFSFAYNHSTHLGYRAILSNAGRRWGYTTKSFWKSSTNLCALILFFLPCSVPVNESTHKAHTIANKF